METRPRKAKLREFLGLPSTVAEKRTKGRKWYTNRGFKG